MNYIEAPHSTYDIPQPSVFLAGGITGCPDWQANMVALLSHTDLTVFNPRRANFPMDDPKAALNQTRWEHQQLRKATAVMFWFPMEALCPIVLYELGAWSMTDKRLFVGMHVEYQRKQDVEIQTALVRRDVTIVRSLSELANQVLDWWRAYEAE